jgi:hypothetical protein
MAYVQVPDDASKIFSALVYWLNDDDVYLDAKLTFLKFLSLTSLGSNEFASSLFLPPPPPLPIFLNNVPLTHSSVQYLIDISPCIVDKSSLIYFLNCLRVVNKDNLSLTSYDLQKFSFNFRLRACHPDIEGGRRVFPAVDKFLIKRPKLKERFLDLICRGDFP